MPRKKTGSPRPPATPLPPVPDRRLMDQQLAQIGRLLEGQDFATMEQANAFLKQALLSSTPPAFAPRTPLEEAQELVYQALETTGPRRVRLARQALARSPDCADAYVLLAEATTDPQEAKKLYEQGVEAGIRALGPEPFAEDVGHFWGIVETRGYMRACQGLAEVLWVLDEREEAIAHAQELLRLNPMDNQGTRYLLANWLLAVGDDAALTQLLRAYPDEGTAAWAYTTALLRFRQQGPGAVATRALKAAVRSNPYVPFYLCGVWEMPDELPAYVEMGDENEAVAYVADALANWLETPDALAWFAETMERLAEQEERQAGSRKRRR